MSHEVSGCVFWNILGKTIVLKHEAQHILVEEKYTHHKSTGVVRHHKSKLLVQHHPSTVENGKEYERDQWWFKQWILRLRIRLNHCFPAPKEQTPFVANYGQENWCLQSKARQRIKDEHENMAKCSVLFATHGVAWVHNDYNHFLSLCRPYFVSFLIIGYLLQCCKWAQAEMGRSRNLYYYHYYYY